MSTTVQAKLMKLQVSETGELATAPYPPDHTHRFRLQPLFAQPAASISPP